MKELIKEEKHYCEVCGNESEFKTLNSKVYCDHCDNIAIKYIDEYSLYNGKVEKGC